MGCLMCFEQGVGGNKPFKKVVICMGNKFKEGEGTDIFTSC